METATTMDIFNFPDEILQIIIDDMTFDDTCNFLRACPNMGKWIKGYNSIDWCYRDVNLSNDTDGNNTHNPFHLLQDLLPNRRLATYVRSVRLGQWDNPLRDTIDDVLPGREGHELADKKFGKLIAEEVRECAYVPESEKDLLIDDIKYGDIDACTAMLLTLLPGVREMTLLEGFVVGPWVSYMIYWIARASEEPDFDISSAPLRNLEAVRTESRYHSDGEAMVVFLAQCSALPSVTTLDCQATKCAGDSPGWSWGWEHPFGLMSVREINIKQSSIRPDLLGCLLERTPLLKRLSYTVIPESELEWPPFEICRIFEDYAADNLEELDLDWIAEYLRLGSLQQLTKLKKLRVRSKALAYQYLDETQDLRPLVESLPRSIEDLQLIPALSRWWGEENEMSQNMRYTKELDDASNLNLEGTARLFEGLAEMKDDRLPNLKSITFDGPYENAHKGSDPYNKKIRMACRAAGVALLGCGLLRRHQSEIVDDLFESVEDEIWYEYAAHRERGFLG